MAAATAAPPMRASDGSGTEHVPRPEKGPPSEFAMRVWVLGGKPERFAFDQPRLEIGRGREAHLRLEHACISRRQLAIERSLGAGGEVRFRIIPGEKVTNPTYINDRPAIEGALRPGDLIAVGARCSARSASRTAPTRWSAT
jgi:hypothetical protein